MFIKRLRHPLVALVLALSMVASACATNRVDSPGSRSTGTTLTVYSATGLGTWYRAQFAAFTRETGITVEVVEGGSGELVSLVHDEQSDPRADLLVVLPPFIQKAARAGLLQPSGVDAAGISSPLIGPGGIYVPIVDNALCFIVSPAANPQPVSWADLLSPQFKGKLQYSTPGQAGDGTAMLLLLQHLMGKPAALDYLAALQANNVGPAPSTAAMQAKVSSAELLVANGDVQMNLSAINNDAAKFGIVFPEMPDRSRTTVSIPYVAGVTGGSRHPDEAKTLLRFLLSESVQKSVATEAFGIPVVDAVAERVPADAGAATPNGLLKDVHIWVPDWTAVLAELDYDIAAYQKATLR